MFPTRRAVMCCAAVAAWLLMAWPPSAAAKEAVTWIASYDEAIAVARSSGRPIFLEFRCAP